MHNKFFLHDNWKLKIINYPRDQITISSGNIRKWLPATIPGTVHTDLLKAGLIEDPFKERNEYKLEWISKSEVIYRTKFNCPDNINRDSSLKLVFEGIDTSAKIYLNNNFLGSTQNMFLKYEYDVSDKLNIKDNILELRFESPIVKKSDSINSNRFRIRKAQYSFGWDWGPSYPTSGIWRPVYLLEEDNAVIRSVNFETEKLTKGRAYCKINFKVHQNTDQKLKAFITLENEKKSFGMEINPEGKDQYNAGLIVSNPDLWWPNNMGGQNLYDLSICITDNNGKIIDEIKKKVGIKKIELQLKDKDKHTFRFKVNNEPVYIKGVNWIPADSFLPRINENKYKDLLTLAKNANVNMVRVWGGGIYENDSFYDLCDKLGLLVWQDFMFACGTYPEHDDFLKNISEEITQNIDRLRNHPSIAIWCGNNENEWIWYREGNGSYKQMPGYKIFHDVIPGLINTLDRSRPYWPTSPFGYDEDPNSQTSGNRHQWDIWSKWLDYKQVYNDKSLFVTEFGFQAPANPETFNKFLPVEKRKIQDSTFEYYNKQIEGPERVIRFIASHFPLTTRWKDFIYMAQLNQGIALKTCVEHWRSNGVTNGSIIWQLNDCWPVTSWSLIDSEIKPKMAFHFIKNAFAQTIVLFNKSISDIRINILNENEEGEAILVTKVIDLKTGICLSDNSRKIVLEKKGYTEVHKLKLKKLPEDDEWIIITSLYDGNKNIIHRNFYLQKEWKQIKLPPVKINSKLVKKSGKEYLILSSNKPAFFVDVFYPGVNIEDRGFILLPGEKKQLGIIKGKNGVVNKNKIKIYSLNNYLKN